MLSFITEFCTLFRIPNCLISWFWKPLTCCGLCLQLSRAVRLVMVIWLVALGLAVPQAIQFGMKDHQEEDGTVVVLCTVTKELVQHAFEISTLVFFVAPMTLITVLYALIGLKLRRSRLLPAAKRTSIGSTSERGSDRTSCKSYSAQNYVIRMLGKSRPTNDFHKCVIFILCKSRPTDTFRQCVIFILSNSRPTDTFRKYIMFILIIY